MKVLGVKSIRILVETFCFYKKNGSPLPLVKTLDLTSGSSVRGKVCLILVKIIFNCFKFYSIDRL